MKVTPDLISAVQQLDPAEFDAFLAEAIKLRQPPKARTLSPRESKQLREINRGLPESATNRYQRLSRARRRRSLTVDEHAELLQLTHEFESRDAERAAALAKLAKIRDIPVRVLMRQLGIQAPPVDG
jgi:hypothetical protein